MKLIHLHTDIEGVRFYKKSIKGFKDNFTSEEYRVHYKKNTFLDSLSERENKYDIVLITAHGAEDSIIVYWPKAHRLEHSSPYRRYITKEDTKVFNNNFVFTVACNTAKELGPEAITAGAECYLGYDIEIGKLFFVSNKYQISRDIKDIYEQMSKKIFTEELVDAMIRFVDEFQTVKLLRQDFALRLEIRMNRLFEMKHSELQKCYGSSIDYGKWEKNWIKLKPIQLGILNEILEHLLIIGDEKYICMLGFTRCESIKDEKIISRLENAEFVDKKYQETFQECYYNFMNCT